MTQHGLSQVSKPEICYFSKFYFKYFDNAQIFQWVEGCDGILKKKQKFKLNKKILFSCIFYFAV